jgi:L-threonylcarbamoyladenylate synthase
LRPGAIIAEQISALIGPVTVTTEAINTPKSPGQMLTHYAPALPLRLNATSAQTGEALLGFGPIANTNLNLSMTGDLSEAATNLFAMLRALDDSDRFEGIAVSPIPRTGLGLAINDRLHRAAAH